MKRSIRFDDSSNVTSATLDGGQLTITFKSGGTYRYLNVQPHQFADLCGAPSAGIWVRTVLVKAPDAYPCAKLNDVPSEQLTFQLIASMPDSKTLDLAGARDVLEQVRKLALEALSRKG